MKVIKIEWLNREAKEALLEVVSEQSCIICFSHPCTINEGDLLIEPLECFGVENIIKCNDHECKIKRNENSFKYEICGELKNKEIGLIEACGFILHIDEEIIPYDIEEGMFVSFVASRIDIW